jgi:hypothetical protein
MQSAVKMHHDIMEIIGNASSYGDQEMQSDDAESINQLKMRLQFSEASKASNPEEFGLRLHPQKNSDSACNDHALDILGTSMEEDRPSTVILHSDNGNDDADLPSSDEERCNAVLDTSVRIRLPTQAGCFQLL